MRLRRELLDQEPEAPVAGARGLQITGPELGFLVLALALGFQARIYGLGGESLWLDEAYNVYWARQPVPDILTQSGADAKLFTLLQKTTLLVAGDSDFAVRLIPLICSLLTAVFVFKGAATIAPGAAWPATSLYLLFPIAISYGRIGRAYALLLLAASALLWLSLKFVRQPTRRDLALLIGVFVLTMYTHKSAYFLAPVLIPLLVLGADFFRKNRGCAAACLLVGGAFCLPLVFLELEAAAFSSSTYSNVSRLAPRGLSAWLYPLYSIYNMTPQTVYTERSILGMLGVGAPLIPLAHALYLVPVGAGAFAWMSNRGRSTLDRSSLGLLLLWAVIPTIGMAVMSLLGMPVYLAGRNDLPILLPMILVPVCGLPLIASAPARAFAVASLVLSLLPYHLSLLAGARPTFRGNDRANASKVSAAMAPQDICVFVGHIYFSYERYFDPAKKGQCANAEVTAALNPRAPAARTLDAVLQNHLSAGTRVWIMAPQDAFSKPEHLEGVRNAVRGLAQVRGLRVEEQSDKVLFDWQGRAIIMRLAVEKTSGASE